MEVFRLSPYLTQLNGVFAGSATNALTIDCEQALTMAILK